MLPIRNLITLSEVNILPLSPYESLGMNNFSQWPCIGMASLIVLPLQSSLASGILPPDMGRGFTFLVMYL